MDESDGLEEALVTTVRLAAMAGARLGSEIARAREDRLTKERIINDREADRLSQRFEAEKRVAVAELSQVHRAAWWERADPGRIGQTYATARAWAREAPEAAQAERKMRTELRDRYGIDMEVTDPRTVTAEVEAWRQRLAAQRGQEAGPERTADTAERAEAAVLLDQAAREDRWAAWRTHMGTDDLQYRAALIWIYEHDEKLFDRLELERMNSDTEDGRRSVKAEAIRIHQERLTAAEREGATPGETAAVAYDSAERRAADLAAMEAKGIDPEVAQSRVHADTGAATPATRATVGASRGRAPKARKAVGRTSPQVVRAGVER